MLAGFEPRGVRQYWQLVSYRAALRTLAGFGLTSRMRAGVAAVVFCGALSVLYLFGNQAGQEEAKNQVMAAAAFGVVGASLSLLLFLWFFTREPARVDAELRAKLLAAQSQERAGDAIENSLERLSTNSVQIARGVELDAARALTLCSGLLATGAGHIDLQAALRQWLAGHLGVEGELAEDVEGCRNAITLLLVEWRMVNAIEVHHFQKQLSERQKQFSDIFSDTYERYSLTNFGAALVERVRR